MKRDEGEEDTLSLAWKLGREIRVLVLHILHRNQRPVNARTIPFYPNEEYYGSCGFKYWSLYRNRFSSARSIIRR